MAWFYAVAYEVGEPSPYRLQQLFQPDQIYRKEGKPTSSGAWNKYRLGMRLPMTGVDTDGRRCIATAVGIQYADTLAVLEHPLWKAMAEKTLPIRDIAAAVKRLPRSEAHYYRDLSAVRSGTYEMDIIEAAGNKIWVNIGDYMGAFNHFAIHLMLLRVDTVRLDLRVQPRMAKNIGRLLGFVAEVPWIHPFYIELFDWMDANVWGDLFKWIDLPGVQRGWRRTASLWITTPTAR